MDANTLITLLFGAGGAGALAGVANLVAALRKGRLANEETLIARLNVDSRQQGERADRADTELASARREFESEAATLRRQRDRARDRAAEFRTLLIGEGRSDVPTLDDLYV